MPSTLRITEQERAERWAAVEQSLASIHLEGLEPGEGAVNIIQRYADGELTIEEMGAEIDGLHARQFRSLSLPRK